MNFSISSSVGIFGGLILFSALLIGFSIVAVVVVRLVRGEDDAPTSPAERPPPEDDPI